MSTQTETETEQKAPSTDDSPRLLNFFVATRGISHGDLAVTGTISQGGVHTIHIVQLASQDEHGGYIPPTQISLYGYKNIQALREFLQEQEEVYKKYFSHLI
jgi:hypothetical protein